MVQIPDIKMARLGLNPISNGASTVAPNIANACCTPNTALCKGGKYSFVATGR